MVKNSLARRATEGTPLAPAFEGADGTLAVVWGGEDIVSLAKEVVSIAEDKEFAAVRAQGRRDGRPAARGRPGQGGQQVAEPPGAAQHFVGPDPEPGREAVGQLLGAGGKLASQIKKKSEEGEEEAQPSKQQACRVTRAAPERQTANNRW